MIVESVVYVGLFSYVATTIGCLFVDWLYWRRITKDAFVPGLYVALLSIPITIFFIGLDVFLTGEVASEPLRRPTAVYSLQASEPVPFLRAPTPTTIPPVETTVPDTTTTTESLTEQSRGVSEAPVGYSWDDLAHCETGGTMDWATNTGNGYSGGVQFAYSTWTNYGGLEYTSEAWQASREQQIVIAERVLAVEGWRAWPRCSAKLGYR
jgi:hypothetical protein